MAVAVAPVSACPADVVRRAGGREYERLASPDGLRLPLHRWDVQQHSPIGTQRSPTATVCACGLRFATSDAAVRATALYAEVVLPRHRNPPDGDGGSNHWELWLRDLDGYTVVLSSPDGSPMVTGNRDATSRVDSLRLNEAFQPERHHEDRKRD